MSTTSNKSIARAVFWPLFLVAVIAVVYVTTQRYAQVSPVVAFITADSTPYWERVLDGARDAAEMYNADLRIVQADGTLDDQNQKLAGVMAQGVSAVAISPVDAVRQTGTLRGVAQKASLITMDSDSEFSERYCFVGTDNYNAGRSCADLVREALPNGGRVLIVAGPLDKANGRERRQGLIDSLLGRETRSAPDSDPVATPLTNSRFSIPMTLVDQLDPAQATAQIVEALTNGSVFDAIVGLYGYHAIAIADALEQHGSADIRVIGFDALPETLDAIEDGEVFGVIAQDQHGYGFQSVRMAVEAAAGFDSAPLNRQLDLPPVTVTLSSLAGFREQLDLKNP
jgi:ribose transport system substrate-binding protein